MIKQIVNIFLIFLTTQAFSQVYNFRNFFVDDGLSQSQVTDIDSDKDGNIWLATYGGGVDCFDGVDFHNYGLNEGMPHHQVKDIYVEGDRVWIGLQKGGCCIIENNKVRRINEISLEKSTISKIHGHNQRIYIGTEEGFLFRLKNETEVELIHSFNESGIIDIKTWGNDLIVATQKEGVWRITDDDIDQIIDLEAITSIDIVGDEIWVGADRKVTVFDSLNASRRLLSIDYPIMSITSDSANNCVWLATYGGGVIRYCDDNRIELKEENGLSSNYTISIHTDSYGLVWIGTDGAGLSKFMGFQFTHYSFNSGHSGEAIMSILKDKNDLWFASYGNGLFKLNSKVYRFGTDNFLPTDSYYSMIKLKNGDFWLASKSNGIVVFNPISKRVKHINSKNSRIEDELLHITKDNSGLIYVTSRNGGVFIYKDNEFYNLSIKNGLPENHINYTFIDHDDNIWLATASSGIVQISRDDLNAFILNETQVIKYQLYFFKNLNIQPQVLTIAQDNNERIWFGLFGEGLGYIENGKIQLIDENKQLLSLNVYGLTYDQINSRLWVGTDKGLIYMEINSDSKVVKIQSFSSSDGFTGVECNRNSIFVDEEQNNVWVGTVKGVTKFDLDLYIPSKIAPKLQITNASYYNNVLNFQTYTNERLINWSQAPNLPHDSSHIVIDFKGIDQWQPDKVKYTWNLGGLNSIWHNLSSLNSVEYSYLPPGKYIFRLRAKGGMGEWSKNTLSLPFIVKTPFHQTTAFYLLMGFLLVALFIGYFYFRQYSLHKRNKRLKEAVMERTMALNNEKIIVEQQKEELRAQTDHLERANKELEKLSLVASKTDNAVLIADKDGKWEWANSGFEKMYGYTLSEFIEERGNNILNSSSSTKITHILDESVKLKKSVTYTTKGLKKDKTEMWVQSTLTPIFDLHGRLKRFVVIDTNITHIKKINNELRKLSLVASKTDNSVIMMDKTGKINWVNDAFHRYYDLSLEEFKVLYQKKIFDLHGDLKNIFDPEEIVKSRKSKSFVSSYITGKGVHKWIQTVVTPVSGLGSTEEQLIAIETDITRIKEVEEEVKAQRQKSDELLLNILPEETAEELKSQGQAQPRYYKSATVMFTDFKNFTKYCEELTPKQLVDELREYFNAFDDVVTKYFVEKIKTIGDAYMCVGGLPLRNRSHPFDVVLSALEIQTLVKQINNKKVEEGRQPWEMRVGIHTGDLVAGVVGKKKFAYDIWGETVNVASRMEGACEVGKVNISGETYEKIKDYFECTYRGKVDAKSNGKFDMYFVDRIRPEYSADKDGIAPNDDFREQLSRF
jgi:PAS domain S-box-containing protein